MEAQKKDKKSKKERQPAAASRPPADCQPASAEPDAWQQPLRPTVPATTPLASCLVPPFWHELANSKRILLAGCGGGYDFFSALPLFFALRRAGLTVYLLNFAFTRNFSSVIKAERLTAELLEVTADSTRTGSFYNPAAEPYWPEQQFAAHCRNKLGFECPVYMLEHQIGVTQAEAAYRAVVAKHGIDSIVLCDGGTDSLMFGDEEGLGTPTEDMTSIAAVMRLGADTGVTTKLLACLGFGVDCFHGVNHHLFLENVAELQRHGHFLGCFSLLPQQEEFQLMSEAYKNCGPINSIVTSSVVSAVEGRFGDYHSKYTKDRTQNSRLYITPLMSTFFTFRLAAVAQRVRYLDLLANTTSHGQVQAIIFKWRTDNGIDKPGEFVGKRIAQPLRY